MPSIDKNFQVTMDVVLLILIPNDQELIVTIMLGSKEPIAFWPIDRIGLATRAMARYHLRHAVHIPTLYYAAAAWFR